MRCKKSILIFVLCAVFVCILTFGAGAKEYLYGDANQSGRVEISDVTLIQKCLAGRGKLDKLSNILADVNNDGRVDITDATLIQRYLSAIVSDFGENRVVFDNEWLPGIED